MENLKKYIVTYLNRDLAQGSMLCMAGKWGCGKTYFWEQKIKKSLDEKDRKNIRLSLYGVTSTNQILYNILSKLSIGKEEDYLTLIELADTYQKGFAKIFNFFGKKAVKIKLKEHIKEFSPVVCLDDFERKSSKLDLNELFGFLDRFCEEYPQIRFVLIFNDEAFEGKDMKIYKETKEKIIAKFINFNPSCSYLFDLVFNANDIVNIVDLQKYKNTLLDIVEKLKIKNGRIYKKIFLNVVEWYESNKAIDENIVGHIALMTICFAKYDLVLDCDCENDRGLPTKDGTSKLIGKHHFYVYNLFSELLVQPIHECFLEKAEKELPIKHIIDLIIEKIDEAHRKDYKKELEEKKLILEAIYKFGYLFSYRSGINNETIINESHLQIPKNNPQFKLN